MTLLSFDPGDSCGLSMWVTQGRRRGQCLWSIKMSYEEFIEWCVEQVEQGVSVIDTVVTEDFTLRPRAGNLNKKGNKLKAPQGIGTMKLFTKLIKAPMILQPSDRLKIAALHSDTPIVNHFGDDVSSFLHGWYYFETQGMTPNELRVVNGRSKLE